MINKLTNDLIQLENSNNLNFFEKELMAEKVKGLYEAYENLVGSHSIIHKIDNEIAQIYNTSKELIENEASINANYISTVNDRKRLIEEYQEFVNIKNELKEEKPKIIKSFRERYSILQGDNQSIIAEREKFKQQYFDLEKKYSDLSEEYKKLRLKIKQKANLLELDEEKYCRKCQKTYFEIDNFN